jgi:hypothetical protein
MSVSIVEDDEGLDFIGSSSKDEQYRFFSIEVSKEAIEVTFAYARGPEAITELIDTLNETMRVYEELQNGD